MTATISSSDPTGAAPVALSIAGSDPSGGAGVQADLKTFHQHGVYGAAAIAIVTAQTSETIRAVTPLDPGLVLAQIDSVLDDLTLQAAKTGALGTAAIAEAVAARASGFDFPLVVDPVITATDGTPLLDEEGREVLRSRLLPAAAIVTPNCREAAYLSGREVESVGAMKDAAKEITRLGVAAVLVTGGGGAEEAVDVLYIDGEYHTFREERIKGPTAHGTGCTLSAAISANLACGLGIVDAVRAAKKYVTLAIRSMRATGKGTGLLNHLASAMPEDHVFEGSRSGGMAGP